MFNRNELWIGLIVGLMLPSLGFFVLYQLFGLLESQGAASGSGLSPNFRERTLFIVAVALNLWPLNYYRKRRWEDSMRGVVVATAALALYWLFRYGLKMFG